MKKIRSRSFLKFFVLLLVAETVTIIAARLLLDLGVYSWLHHKAQDLVSIAESARKAVDWSKVDEIKQGMPATSPIFQRYRQSILNLNKEYFPNNDGDLAVLSVVNGQEVVLVSFDPYPYEVFEPANRLENEAFTQGKLTFSPLPYAEDTGTSLSAFSPVSKEGKVIALIDAEFDASSLENFQQIVHAAFWWAILPACLVSLLLASFLAVRFVEPMEFLRNLQQMKASANQEPEKPKEDTWNLLTPREREVALLVGEGLKNREIAEKLFVTEETVKKHLKNIFQKLAFTNRINLALLALAHTPSQLPKPNSPYPKVEAPETRD